MSVGVSLKNRANLGFPFQGRLEGSYVVLECGFVNFYPSVARLDGKVSAAIVKAKRAPPKQGLGKRRGLKI